MELRKRRKGKENDSTSIISHNIVCEGSPYKDLYLKMLRNGEGIKGKRIVMKRMNLAK
jgi:hypothetical protein